MPAGSDQVAGFYPVPEVGFLGGPKRLVRFRDAIPRSPAPNGITHLRLEGEHVPIHPTVAMRAVGPLGEVVETLEPLRTNGRTARDHFKG